MIILLALAALAAAGDPPADDKPASLADLQQVYDDSCAAREFGAYDDLCLQLQQQIKRAEAEQARQARERRRAPRQAPPPAQAAAPAPDATPSDTPPRAR